MKSGSGPGEKNIRRGRIMTNFIRMIKDESGASAAEYALILAVVGVGIIVAAFALGQAVSNSMDCAADTINAQAAVAC